MRFADYSEKFISGSRGKRRSAANDQRGAAMIVVVCVLMVVMILCLTMIVGAYQTLATVQDGRKDAAYYQQAYSFSEALKEQLILHEGESPMEVPSSPTDLVQKIAKFAADGSLFGTEEDPVEEPTLVLTETGRDTDTGEGSFGKLVVTLQKRKTSINRCKLYITVSVLENTLLEASCSASYQTEIFQEGGKDKIRLDFRGYY